MKKKIRMVRKFFYILFKHHDDDDDDLSEKAGLLLEDYVGW